MPFQHTLTKTWKNSDGKTLQRSVQRTFPGEINKAASVANGVSNQLVPVTINLADMGMYYITSDVDVTLKTNSSGSPTDNFLLKAGKALEWEDEGYFANKFTGNITAIYLTNASGQQANVEIRFGSKA